MATPTITVKDAVSKSPDDLVKILGGIYEHSPWVADRLSKKDDLRTIDTITELAAAMKSIVEDASREQKVELLCSHPDLCEKVEALKNLTPESQEEQSRSGLQTLTDAEKETFTKHNTEYRSKFGFPFILAVRNATKQTVLAGLEGRRLNSPEKEFAIALDQVHKIAWMRLLSIINTDDAKGFLTCHVLDTSHGLGAEKMRIHLHRLSPTPGFVGEFITNKEGRLEGGPALQGGKEFTVGVYEWTFFTGDYFAAQGTHTSGTPFLDIIPLRCVFSPPLAFIGNTSCKFLPHNLCVLFFRCLLKKVWD